jgi:uncharacterized protein involved in type VI secretion and phage assembly
VVDNNDPTTRGRLQVKVPSLFGEFAVWAMPCVPYAGKKVGFYSLPPVDAGVWVEFEAGDPSYPVWTGCFWADDEVPDSGGPDIKIWKTAKITARLDDSKGELLLQNDSDSKTTYASTVKIESGSANVTVGESSGISVTVNDGALEVK